MTMPGVSKFQDRLVVGEPHPGHVLLNYGDPAYLRQRGDDPPRLARSEAIFLRIIAYLAFVEGVCIPARYVLQGEDMWRAVRLVEPLIKEGLVVIERRAEAASSVELAAILGLGEIGRQRGEWLDSGERSAKTRLFRSNELGDAYRDLLLGDLKPAGGFSKVLHGGARQGIREGLARAHDAYLELTERSDDRTPEAFSNAVQTFMRPARHRALQWAMARYYSTPMLYDSVTTREMPRSASRLLIDGNVLDPELQPMDTAAPAEAMYRELTLNIPREHEVSIRSQEYCEVILEVRDRYPHARRLFRRTHDRTELPGMAPDLSTLMVEELARQKGERRRAPGFVYTLTSSVLVGGAGLAIGGEPIEALASGVGGGVIGYAAQPAVEGYFDRRSKPWPLAIDYLGRHAPGS